MDLLIVEPLDDEVTRWLEERHQVKVAPELALDPRAFRRALSNVRAAILPGHTAIDAQALQHAPVLRAIGRVSGGAENMDLDACARAGVEVVRSLTAAEAEFMIGALLSMLRRVPVRGPDGLLVGRELGACTVGLVGMAPAARKLSALLQAFGCNVVGYDPSMHASDSLWQRWQVRPQGLRELLEQSDAVCVQLNYFSRYQGLFGERFLPHCKPDQVIVNTGHSALFDDAVLARLMNSGRIAAAWFDSMEPGMLDEGRPLHAIETLQVSPRVASTTRESRLRSGWAVAKRLDEVLSYTPVAPREFVTTVPGVPLDLEVGPSLP
jgi:D-3-phosphoglycerate dehydrogenase